MDQRWTRLKIGKWFQERLQIDKSKIWVLVKENTCITVNF